MSDPIKPVVVAQGWQCPRCHSVCAPAVILCPNCDSSKHPKIPSHVLREVEHELEHARTAVTATSEQPLHPNIRGTFVIHYVQLMLDACKPKP